jgi:hypothetical protein
VLLLSSTVFVCPARSYLWRMCFGQAGPYPEFGCFPSHRTVCNAILCGSKSVLNHLFPHIREMGTLWDVILVTPGLKCEIERIASEAFERDMVQIRVPVHVQAIGAQLWTPCSTCSTGQGLILKGSSSVSALMAQRFFVSRFKSPGVWGRCVTTFSVHLSFYVCL